MAYKYGRIPLPFTNGFYKSRSRPLSSQQCVNWYPNDLESAGLNETSLYACPGLIEVLDSLDGIGRGAHLVSGVLYVVSGEKLYRIDRTATPSGDSFSSVEIGSILGNSRVQMAATKDQLVIVVPDEYAYHYVVGGAITDLYGVTNFLDPVCDVVQINSRFVFAQTGTNIIFHSDLNQGLVYDALNQYTVVQYPRNVGLIVYRNTLYCFGETVTVPFSDQAQLEFAFRPIIGAVIDSGLAAVGAKTNFRDSFIFVGSGENAERSVWLFNGVPNKISPEPLDFIIQNEEVQSVEDSYLMRHSQNGAEFCCLKIGGFCFVYDLTAKRWHERRSRIPDGANYIDAPWRVTAIQQAYNRVFVLDSDQGVLGEISDQAYTEYEINLHRKVVTQPFMNNGARTRVYAIEVYFDVGYEEGDVVALRFSDDGGFTWSEPLTRGLGAVGEYGRRVIFDRMGSFSNSRILEITYTGKNPASFNKLMANAV